MKYQVGQSVKYLGQPATITEAVISYGQERYSVRYTGESGSIVKARMVPVSTITL